jgi:hypothetical protein
MPIGGLNYVDSMVSMPPQDAWMMDNLIARPFGVEIRKGWQYWVPKASSFANEVRTLIPFTAQSNANNKLFAAPAITTGAIYDVTNQNVAPTLALTPSTQPDIAGEWFYCNYTTPGGGFLCMVAGGAGYYVYSAAGGWVEYPTGTGASKIEFPAGDLTTTKDFCFCWVWKNRLWFLKRSSAVAYYLPINQISGKVASFDFGAQLDHGGALNYATGWTYDSGSGMDDGLIIVSNEGDALLYEGTDPANAATFQLKGVWYLGRSPTGRRSFCQLGGNVLFLTEYGVSSASDMVAGKLHVADLSASVGYKINPKLARIVSQGTTDKYWFLLPYPTEELLLIGTPWINDDVGTRQSFVMNSITNAWSTISEMDILCAEVFQGNFYFGTRTGDVVWGFRNWNDAVSADGVTLGPEVTGRLQGSFQDLGSPVKNKRALRVKIYGFSDSQPSIYVIMKDEYKINELLNTPSPIALASPSWDTSVWDKGIWNSTLGSFRRWIGITGFGKRLSTQLAIRGSGRVLMTDYEVLFETGIGL